MLQNIRYKILFALFFSLSLFGERGELFEKIEDVIKRNDISHNKKSVLLISDNHEKIFISQEFARKLLSIDSFGRLKRVDEKHRGHHPTVCIGGLFFKSDTVLPPLDPMMETAAYFFQRYLFQEGVVPSRFFFVKNVEIEEFNGHAFSEQMVVSIIDGKEEEFVKGRSSFTSLKKKNYLLQITPEVLGELGTDFVRKVEKKEGSFLEISAKSFGEHLISSFLLHVGDHKGENFIVVGERAPKKLVFIDNDGFLCVNNQKITDLSIPTPFGSSKNLLFFLEDLLDKTIDPSLRNHLLDISGAEILSCWLKRLEKINICLKEILKENPGLHEQFNRCYLPLKLREGSISLIHEKFLEIQKLLKRDDIISYRDLFISLEGDLYHYTQMLNSKYCGMLKRVRKMYSNERPYKIDDLKNDRIGIAALKGRWLFNALGNLKRIRNISLEDSLQELISPKKMEEVDLVEDFEALFLKNVDSDFFRKIITKHFISILKEGYLPDLMDGRYPYSLLDKEYREKGISKELLERFIGKQEIYEEFVTACSKKGIHPNYSIQEILRTFESKESK
ncbi:MAG: hypothetical protein SP1CHLAM9_02370 [Chlamydiia bacterium]|nr:hypothetical protein [Chlamydiia bacterium]MCH9624457.1 hypothetical protein [Chlamydiia bacterium]